MLIPLFLKGFCMIAKTKTGIQGLSSLIRGKSVALIGLGRTHTPLVRLFCDLGAENVTARDKNTKARPELEKDGAALLLGENYLENLTEDIILRTPAMRPDHPALLAAQMHGALVTSEMELFIAFCPAPIYGITGSDGKTTTSTLTAKLLESAGKRVFLGGNIGLPLLPRLSEIAENDAAVLELSSFQLMGMRVSPEHAIITNLSENHLDWHRDMTEYCEAKTAIFKNQTPSDLLVLNADNGTTAPLAEEAPGRMRFFSRRRAQKNGTYCLTDDTVFFAKDGEAEPFFSRSEILVPGDHNLENYLAAIALTHDTITVSGALSVARSFSGVAHRMELVGVKGGVRFYNSSIDSSPARSGATLKAFPQKPVVIMGGYDKNLNYAPLAPIITERVKALVLTGQTAPKIEKALKAYAPFAEAGIPLFFAPDFAGAFHLAAKTAQKGDLVLLSPASASFDQFRDFEERGEVFRTLVKELEENA